MDTRQKLALQVPEVPEDFNPDFSVFPESAEEYLKSVIYQRRHIPDVVKIDPANFPFSTRVRPVVENDKQEQESSNSKLLPTKEWQNIQKKKFKENQKRVENLRNIRQEQEQDQIDDDSLYSIIREADKVIKYCKNHQPLLSTILSLGQRNLETLLSHLSDHLEDRSESMEYLNKILHLEDEELREKHEWISKWIYAGLLCLQIPLDGSTHNTLRVIAKSSIKIRNFLNLERHTLLIPFNLLICVIANNFYQLDLE